MVLNCYKAYEDAMENRFLMLNIVFKFDLENYFRHRIPIHFNSNNEIYISKIEQKNFSEKHPPQVHFKQLPHGKYFIKLS